MEGKLLYEATNIINIAAVVETRTTQCSESLQSWHTQLIEYKTFFGTSSKTELSKTKKTEGLHVLVVMCNTKVIKE